MPPKKKQQQPVKKKKDNVDKTFGMKNKNKSTKVQNLIKQVQAQSDPKKEEAKRKKLEEKKLREAAEAERKALFNPVIGQREKAAMDPRKYEKKDLYQDSRKEKEADTMDSWDEAKLRSVIFSKHGNPRTTTNKVCKYFIEAVENGKYGWFWVCPNNGDKCMYRHSLPEGFVLKTKEQKRLERESQDKKPKITLEEFIETERERLDKKNLTPITKENFAKWKQSHTIERLNKEEEDALKRKPTGREVVLKKYAENKKFDFADELDLTKGSAWDLSQFSNSLDDVKEAESSDIKDYGDGANPTFEIPKKDDFLKQGAGLTA